MNNDYIHIGIDVGKLLDSHINDILLRVNTGDPKADILGRELVKLANRHAIFGMEALEFVDDMLKTLAKIEELHEKIDEEEGNEE